MFFFRSVIASFSLILAVGAFWLALQSAQNAIAESNLAILEASKLGRGQKSISGTTIQQQILYSPHSAVLYSELAYALGGIGRHEEAVSAMETAVSLRRKWPYDWMALAQIYANARIYDDRMTVALYNLDQFGPSERSLVYRKAVFVMRHWYGLSNLQREQLLPSLQIILENKRWARRFAVDLEAMGRTQLFCRRFSKTVSYGPAWCAYFEKRARQRKSSAL